MVFISKLSTPSSCCRSNTFEHFLMSSKLFIGFSAILATVLLGYMYADSLAFLFGRWSGSEDYSHGMFVPLISLFLIWKARNRIAVAGAENSWWGLVVISAGLLLYWMGEF